MIKGKNTPGARRLNGKKLFGYAKGQAEQRKKVWGKVVPSPKVNMSNMKSNILGKFKPKKIPPSLNVKFSGKSELNKDYISFTPKSRDIERDTSLDFKLNPKKNGFKQKYTFGDKKQFSKGFFPKTGKNKNLSVLSKKCRAKSKWRRKKRQDARDDEAAAKGQH